jgi:two-component system CitB family sensor kinase
VKVPIRDESGEVVGTLSVGELVDELREEALAQSLPLALASLLAIIAGGVLAWFVTSWLRRKLYGVEPDQLAQLLQAHRAVMESTEEGVITTDDAGRVQLVNAEAARMLGATAADLVGSELDALPEELAELLADDEPVSTELRLVHLERGSVYVQARATTADGRAIGRMLSLRDRSQLDDAIARLEAQREQAQLLRIEAHEFENRMHVLSGLLELGEYDEARAYLESQPAGAHPSEVSRLELDPIGPTLLAALVSAHADAAAREHVTIELAPECEVPAELAVDADDLLVVANLVTNAVEATGFGGTVRLTLAVDPGDDALEVVVEDDGPGLPLSPERLTTAGVTTKPIDRERHGIGLRSVREVVDARGGELRFGESPLGGALVEAVLPRPAANSPDEPADQPTEPPAEEPNA